MSFDAFSKRDCSADQEQEDELPEEVPGGHAESHRKVSGPGAGKQGDYHLKLWVFTFFERHVMNDILEFTNTGTSKDTENITSTSARRRFRTQN